MTFTGCKKEAFAPTFANNEEAQCGQIPTNSGILGLLEDSLDVNKSNIHKVLFHYSSAFKTLINNSTFASIITNSIMQDTSKLNVSLHDLALSNPLFKQELNLLLKQSILSFNIYPIGFDPNLNVLMNQPNWDADAYLYNLLIYQGYQHSPIVLTTKPISIGVPQNPITCIGFDINDCDEIPGWNANQEIAVSESFAKSLNNNVFIITTGEVTAQSGSLIKLSQDQESTTANQNINLRAQVAVDINSFSIKNGSRFEKKGKSEIRGNFVFFTSPLLTQPYATEWDISKGDIQNSKTFTSSNGWAAWDAIWPGTALRQMKFGVFEYDWFSSQKIIPTTNINGISIPFELEGRREFTSEFYHGTGCLLGGTGIGGLFGFVPSTFNVNNSKCMFNYIRVI